jgi:hypothetical protein
MTVSEVENPFLLSTPATNTDSQLEDEKLRRFVIRRMVLENFKSYAGRVEIGPFHKVTTTLRMGNYLFHMIMPFN